MLVVGIAIATPRDGVGLTVIRGTDVIEAVTVVSKNPAVGAGIQEIATLGRLAVESAAEIVADHIQPGEVVVWAVEDVSLGRPRGGTQQARAAAARADVQAVTQGRAAILSCLLSCIPKGDPVFVLPAIGAVDPTRCPATLSGTKPQSWRGGRGLRRDPQRTAWVAARQVVAAITPGPEPADYVRCLAGLLRAYAPDPATLFAACTTVLDVVARPTGAPALTAGDLAAWALAQGLVADTGAVVNGARA